MYGDDQADWMGSDSYELLKWEERQCEKRGKPVRRELEWATIAREIAAMNKPYSRQN